LQAARDANDQEVETEDLLMLVRCITAVRTPLRH
jgi:hypothetical protein